MQFRREGRPRSHRACAEGVRPWAKKKQSITSCLSWDLTRSGRSVFLPSLITTIGKGKTGLGDRLREKVSSVLKKKNENSSSLLGFAAVNEMELVKSTVYEALGLNPPVPLQYGRARADFVLSSHESSYRVLKGELLCGYQPLAMKDPMVFKYRDLFVPERFMGDEGTEQLHYLFWSDGPETELPLRMYNNQCAAKDYVVATVV